MPIARSLLLLLAVGPASAARLSLRDATAIGLDPDVAGLVYVYDAGDLNGDGLTDLVVRGWSDGTLAVFYGAVGGPRVGAPDVIVETTSARGASSVTGGVDVTCDGLPDLIVGRGTASDLSGGSVEIYSGLPPSGTLTPADAAARVVHDSYGGAVGRTVATYPDQDGDGCAELVVGDPARFSLDGAVYLIPSGLGLTGDVTAPGPGMGVIDGTGLSGGGLGETHLHVIPDMTGDGTPELGVGGDTRYGVVVEPWRIATYRFTSSARLFRRRGALPDGVAVGGDVDGDGIPDFAMTDVNSHQAARGKVSVIPGADVLAQPTGRAEDVATYPTRIGFEGGPYWAWGSQLAFVPDVTGDGLDELVGATRDRPGGDALYAVSSQRIAAGTPGRTTRLSGPPLLARDVSAVRDLGFTLLRVADLDGDGVPDLVSSVDTRRGGGFVGL